MGIDTTFLRNCIQDLENVSCQLAELGDTDATRHDLLCAAGVRKYEQALEQSGKLLRKRLAAYFASNLQADRLAFRDLFRHAARHGLLELDSVERWLAYRVSLDNTLKAHGEYFADTTLKLLPQFIEDAKALADIIEAAIGD